MFYKTKCSFEGEFDNYYDIVMDMLSGLYCSDSCDVIAEKTGVSISNVLKIKTDYNRQFDPKIEISEKRIARGINRTLVRWSVILKLKKYLGILGLTKRDAIDSKYINEIKKVLFEGNTNSQIAKILDIKKSEASALKTLAKRKLDRLTSCHKNRIKELLLKRNHINDRTIAIALKKHEYLIKQYRYYLIATNEIPVSKDVDEKIDEMMSCGFSKLKISDELDIPVEYIDQKNNSDEIKKRLRILFEEGRPDWEIMEILKISKNKLFYTKKNLGLVIEKTNHCCPAPRIEDKNTKPIFNKFLSLINQRKITVKAPLDINQNELLRIKKWFEVIFDQENNSLARTNTLRLINQRLFTIDTPVNVTAKEIERTYKWLELSLIHE